MLALSRKCGEAITVYKNGEVVLRFLISRIKPQAVRILFAADDEYIIMRDELIGKEKAKSDKSENNK